MSHQRVDNYSRKIAVIGAGLGGLTAAARLAKRGHQVTIYERSEKIGGKCQTEWIDGYGFDTGPSLLTLPAVYRDFFMKTGGAVDLGALSVDPAFEYNFADGTQIIFPNLSRHKTIEAIESFAGSESAREWKLLMERAEAMWQASRGDFVEKALPSTSQLLRRRNLLKDLSTIAPLSSLRRFTRNRLSDSRLRMIIDRYATYTGSDPRKVPAVLLTIAFVEEAFGAWHIAGGLGRLSELVADRCQKLGVEIKLKSGVKQINHGSGRVSGITLNSGEEISADYVISNVDSYLLYNEMVDHSIAKKERRAINATTPSLSGFSLLLGLAQSEKRALKNHHTVFFPRNYDREFDQIFIEQKPVADPTIYICSPNDPQMVPQEGCENLFILINAPRHNPESGWDWSDEKFVAAYGEKIIDLLEARGVTIRSRLVVKKFRSPLDIEKDYASAGGSIYGPSSNGIRAAFKRAPNKSQIPGLFSVGGSAHPGGGLPLVGLSGEIVADAISAEVNS
jgi:phytoene desaturase